MLKPLKIKAALWRIITFSALFVMIAALICGIVALITGNDLLGALSMMIVLPLIFAIGFIIQHWINLDSKKKAMIAYIENPRARWGLFFKLIEKYLRGEIKGVFKDLGLKRIKVLFALLNERDMDFVINGEKKGAFIHLDFHKTFFYLSVDFDEEEEDIKIEYPPTNSIDDLVALAKGEIEKEIKRKENQIT